MTTLLVYMDFFVDNYQTLLVIKVYFNVLVLTLLAELSSFFLTIPLFYMDFYVNNYKHCLL